MKTNSNWKHVHLAEANLKNTGLYLRQILFCMPKAEKMTDDECKMYQLLTEIIPFFEEDKEG